MACIRERHLSVYRSLSILEIFYEFKNPSALSKIANLEIFQKIYVSMDTFPCIVIIIETLKPKKEGVTQQSSPG